MNAPSGEGATAGQVLQAFFLPASPGQRFCVYHPARGGETRGLILYLHPFAEEMNKSRRMAALQARAFSEAGYAVLQIDLLGCGDSSGDFVDASWDDWLNDVALAAAWLRKQADAPLWLWGLRASCLLACEAAGRFSLGCNFLFWQAPANGKSVLQQFLRLKVAADALAGSGKGAMEALRKSLASGEAVDIAGYGLSSALAQGLEQARLLPPETPARMELMELSSQPEAELSPVAARNLQDWLAAAQRARAQVVQGPGFWASTEIEVAPALIPQSLRALETEPASP